MAGAPIPVLALVPGLNNTRQVWDGVAASLGRAVDSRAFDCPPHDTVEQVADALLARLPAKFFLCGFSFGGYVALAMLERAPQRIAGLALVNSGAGADNEAQRAARAKAIATAEAGGHEAMVAAQASLVFRAASLANPALMETRAQMVREYGAARLIAHSRACMARPDRTHVVAMAGCPLLVVAAGDDRVIPTAAQKAFAHSLTGAQYVEIEAAGHMLPLEQPAALADALRTWINSAAD